MICPHCDLPLQPMNAFGDRDDVFGVPTCQTCGWTAAEHGWVEQSRTHKSITVTIKIDPETLKALQDAVARAKARIFSGYCLLWEDKE